jgi:hypothetical protein
MQLPSENNSEDLKCITVKRLEKERCARVVLRTKTA